MSRKQIRTLYSGILYRQRIFFARARGVMLSGCFSKKERTASAQADRFLSEIFESNILKNDMGWIYQSLTFSSMPFCRKPLGNKVRKNWALPQRKGQRQKKHTIRLWVCLLSSVGIFENLWVSCGGNGLKFPSAPLVSGFPSAALRPLLLPRLTQIY